MAFEKSSWIWHSEMASVDEYAEFSDELDYTGGAVTLRISADSDYVFSVNGDYVCSSQYGDFEHYKIYDEVDVTPYLKTGKNALSFIAHHYGINSSRHCSAAAGIIFEIAVDGLTVLGSRAGIPSRRARGYVSGRSKIVTPQLGLGFAYDATDVGEEFHPAVTVDKRCTFFPRPIPKGRLADPTPMRVIKSEGNRILVDLGAEHVGYPTLDVDAAYGTEINVAWGEHVVDGWVRRIISNRDFSFDYVATEGKNVFTSRMLRIAARYMEITASSAVTLNYLGIIPELNGEDELPVRIDNALDSEIYSISMRTLRLSMMEHYVDSPWREQSLYAFDSRNQMLFGYYSLKNMNRDYARASLKLLGEDRSGKGLLSITAPTGRGLAIPSFSLYYIIEMKEYASYTGDLSLAREMLSKMVTIMKEFTPREDGLVYTFPGAEMWNFYDWSEHSAGTLSIAEEPHPDLCINCLAIMALDALRYISDALGIPFPFGDMADVQRINARSAFRTKTGVYTMIKGEEKLTVLGNSLAVLSGVASEEERAAIAEAIVEGRLADCSLSMKIFEYDALLLTDKEKHRDFCLGEVRRNYGMMLDFGSTTVWETLKGEADFWRAGSLCHGWSAIPVYLYHILGIAKPIKEET